MVEPTAGSPGLPPRSNAPVIIRIVLAIVLGLPGIAGLVVFGTLLGEWLHNGYQFQSSDLWIMPVFLIGSEGSICFSILAIGVILRYARWRQAPTASLVLAILSIAVIVVGYQLMLDCLQDDTDDQQVAMVFSIIGLIIIAAPPLLHWWKAGRITS